MTSTGRDPRLRGTGPADGVGRKSELADVGDARVDVAADMVRVVCLDVGRRAGRPREDQVPKAGSEPFHLRFDAIRHVDGRAGRHVAVRPGGVPARRSPRRIPRLVLREEGERAVRRTARGHLALRADDLIERPAEVDRRSPSQAVSGPGHRPRQGPVDLEDTRPVAESLVAPPGPRRESIAGDVDRRLRRRVEDDDPGLRQVVEGLDPVRPSRSRRRAAGPRRRARQRWPPCRPGPTASPTAWAYIPSTRPNDAVSGRSRRTIECAARPTNSACAASPRKRDRARPAAERRAGEPEAGQRQRMARRRGGSVGGAPGRAWPRRGRADRRAAARPTHRPSVGPRRGSRRSP